MSLENSVVKCAFDKFGSCPPNMNSVFRSNSLCKLGRSFFDTSCEELARKLLGKVLIRKICRENPSDSDEPLILAVRIVETESYLGVLDGASHSFRGE